jgi:glycosyltransferase involved in cell wall biosynthesis
MVGWFGRRRRTPDLDKNVELVGASDYFDAAWYRSRYGDHIEREPPADHYLRQGAALGFDPGPLFSTVRYLADHPDVAREGMNPLVHFLRHGQFEGRMPRAAHSALGLDQELWSGRDEPEVCAALLRIATNAEVPEQERLYAAWALVRWYGAQGDWPRAKEFVPILHQADWRYFFHQPLSLVEIDALIRHGSLDGAGVRIEVASTEYADWHDLRLARANLIAARQGNDADHLAAINKIFVLEKLRPLHLLDIGSHLTVDNLSVEPKKSRGVDGASHRSLVSVLVPAFNARDTLPTALEALRNQDWRELEILVIDDCSTDDAAEIAESFAKRDARIRVLRRPFCEGPSAARNSGLHHARGEFITVHDADDWSHPEKIGRQVQYLLGNPEVAACMSHWVRCTDDLVFSAWRIESGWIERNISSLMFRRAVFEDLGYWDRVAAGADSELLQRIIRAYGQRSVSDVLPGVPLSFGRTGGNSLTSSSETHIRTFVSGVRKAYLDAAEGWHRSVEDTKSLYLPEFPERRPFWIPPVMTVDVREFQGGVQVRPDRANVLLVAHSWSTQLFGAERCFIDLVRGFTAVGMNVFVAVPEAGSDEHRSTLLESVVKLFALPYFWWRGGRPAGARVEANFRRLISDLNVRLVYANTSVLYEPLLAARACGARTAIHVHELPESDPDLCDVLKAEPEAIRRHVTGLADNLVATSEQVASWLGAPERTVIIPNTFDEALLELPERSGAEFHVAMLSSNTPKKGLADFMEMARYFSELGVTEITCLLIGPENAHVEALRDQQPVGRVPENVRFTGLASSPVEAIAQADVVVNFSHVEESFGRAVLEAMAGARPVVCYEWGALPELVVDKETGFLVPFGNVQAVAERVMDLYRDRGRCRQIGEAARRRAAQRYARDVFEEKLKRAMVSFVGQKSA